MPVCRIISAQMGSDDELADGRTQINHFKAYTHGGILKNRSIHPLMYSSISDTGDRIWINSNWVPTWRRIRIVKKKIHDRVGDGWVVDCRRQRLLVVERWWAIICTVKSLFVIRSPPQSEAVPPSKQGKEVGTIRVRINEWRWISLHLNVLSSAGSGWLPTT